MGLFVFGPRLLLAFVAQSGIVHSIPTVNVSAYSVSSRGRAEVLTKVIRESSNASAEMRVDPEYPGTAVERMMSARQRVSQLSQEDLNGPWEEVRRKILWAGGLKDLPSARPGAGYTGHSFNDFNHVDLTCMIDRVSDNENDGAVKGIALGNHLGNGIRVASIPDLGPGGSWSTCAMGCNKEPPSDVAHVQFRARVAFKLVWVPNERFDTFVLVDDSGKLLAKGKPTIGLPALSERKMNYQLMAGSKYATEALLTARNVSSE